MMAGMAVSSMIPIRYLCGERKSLKQPDTQIVLADIRGHGRKKGITHLLGINY